METMLATYQLNIEKLDYNYRVLVERDHENTATINQQKRKIARQRDLLTGLKSRCAAAPEPDPVFSTVHAWLQCYRRWCLLLLQYQMHTRAYACICVHTCASDVPVYRYHETDRKLHEENMKLTGEYKRITEQFKDLQLKFRHFEVVDSKKYDDVWKMKEVEVVALAKKIMAADKVLHEQQLGLKWRGPNEDVRIGPCDLSRLVVCHGAVNPCSQVGLFDSVGE